MKEIALACGTLTQVDDSTFERLNALRWHLSNGYPQTSIDLDGKGRKKIRMHVLLTGWKLTDHKDRNKLNNQLDNLIESTNSYNAYNRSRQTNNTSGVTGVYWLEDRKCWKAKIELNKVQHNLGYFKTKEDAIKARKAAEMIYFGQPKDGG